MRSGIYIFISQKYMDPTDSIQFLDILHIFVFYQYVFIAFVLW